MGVGDGSRVRLGELLAGLATVSDLGMGQPPGHAVRTCLLAVGLAEVLGARADEVVGVYDVALLRFVGCTADAHEVAAFSGDEIGLAVAVGPFVMGTPEEEAAALGVSDVSAVAEAKAASLTAHCEVAAMLATRLGLGAEVAGSLRHGFERYDGTGHPAGLAGEAVPWPVRIAVVARDVELWHRRGGMAAALDVVRRRRGRAYDPQVVDAVLGTGPELLARLDEDDPWERVLAVEPGDRGMGPDGTDRVLEVIADVADLKVPHTVGHSRGVARLAADAGAELGLEPRAIDELRRAALVHDLGRCGISNTVWDRPGPLSGEQWERVRLHPYLTERVLARVPALRHLAPIAGAHHESLDGSGYHRGSTRSALGLPARVLAVADAYHAMTQPRPHRPALSSRAVVDELAAGVDADRWDGRAVAAVMAAAGLPPSRTPARWPCGLTDREVEVLRLACQGLSNPQVARRLVLSPKTVGRHLENVYAKAGVSTRAGAALFAVGHELLAPDVSARLG